MSTAEAEYRAAAEVTKEVIWLRRMLRELGFKQNKPTIIFEDNKSTIKMIKNPMISRRNKHIEIDCHFIRDHYELGNIQVEHISTTDQTADLMTKNLNSTSFLRHTSKLLHQTSTIEGDC